MSKDDDPQIWAYAPTGSKLERPGATATVFTVSTHPPYSEELGDALRKRGLREIPAANIERHSRRVWADSSSGEELELIATFVDPVAPQQADAVSAPIARGVDSTTRSTASRSSAPLPSQSTTSGSRRSSTSSSRGRDGWRARFGSGYGC